MRSFSDSYREAGVNIEAGYEGVKLMKKHVERTMIPGVVSDIGGFGGLFAPDLSGMREPVLVSGTDGVGTKLRIAQLLDKHDTIGIDCVAMCVNDIICCGAKPLFFLDYIAIGKNTPEKVATLVSGVAEGCVQAGCALIGGETAEHPGTMAADDYDLAGFSVGIVDEDKIIDGSNIQEGNLLVGLPSSGVHSNGYSLVRSALGKGGLDIPLDSTPKGWRESVAEAVMRPTKLYVKAALAAVRTGVVHGMAHITGGGMYGNVIRIIPKHLDIAVDLKSWERPAIFDLIQSAGIDEEEMQRVFNLGIGYVFVIDATELKRLEEALATLGEKPVVIGEVIKCTSRG